MSTPLSNRSDPDRRILVLAPTGRDGMLTCSLLAENGITGVICSDVPAMILELGVGAGAILIAEEVLAAGQSEPLVNFIKVQPPWSDLPVLLITGKGADSPAAASATKTLGNVTLVERPTRMTALISTVQSALRARARQYQARDHLIERERTAEELKQADRSKDEFLAILAHELRNPLAPIRNSLQILQMTACHDPTAARVCEMMDRQVNHMVRLVDDLMEVSRITRGLVELRKQPTELATIIRSAIETSNPLIEAKQHQLAISLPPKPIRLHGDEIRLEQIFANLLNNAAKYTDPGGQIWLAAKEDGNEIVVTVRDNGIGLSPEVRPMVFDMFMQADRSTNRSQGGLGIGLTLVKNLVELHGGTIVVHSGGQGQGSEFVVRLPMMIDPSPIATQPVTSTQGKQTLPQRVLVVDDNEDSASSLAMLLKFLGTEIRVANDGPTALETIKNYRPNLVLLDIGMPGMDGFAVARGIREQTEFDDMVLIALTGWGQAEDRERTRAAGFDHHLVKPADIAALKSLLTTAGK